MRRPSIRRLCPDFIMFPWVFHRITHVILQFAGSQQLFWAHLHIFTVTSLTNTFTQCAFSFKCSNVTNYMWDLFWNTAARLAKWLPTTILTALFQANLGHWSPQFLPLLVPEENLWGQGFIYNWMFFLSPNQQCQSTEGNVVVIVVVECIYEPYVFSHLVSTSSAECSHCSPSSSLDCDWQYVTLFGFCHASVATRPHFFRQDAQWPWLVQKRFRSAQ